MGALKVQRAGKLDQQITIIREFETVATSGAVNVQWGQLGVLRAELVVNQIAEETRGFGDAEAGPVVFRIRYRPGIMTADRIIYGLGVYEIEAMEEIGRKRVIELSTNMISRDTPPHLTDLPIIDPDDPGNILSSANW
ncbi:Phage head-tail adaptor [Sulfitobacter noctilucae]|uniref:head-tail adaptor protein n=1 Tax=Sulfitobacter noctilucae TaxID=1342302 RepID=UPI00046A8AD0|nr:head-tail adaptor protein [Sulfitobacter noctilucae]KIN60644.1 Phage head-tail adaptor [Sulfitobacter noctilucae]